MRGYTGQVQQALTELLKEWDNSIVEITENGQIILSFKVGAMFEKLLDKHRKLLKRERERMDRAGKRGRPALQLPPPDVLRMRLVKESVSALARDLRCSRAVIRNRIKREEEEISPESDRSAGL